MAKVILNPVLEAIRGKVGDLVFRRWDDQVIVGKMPDRTGIVPTVNQIAQQDRFRLAVLYGKAVMANEEQRMLYDEAADRKGLAVFALMVGDFLNAPHVDEIDMSKYAGKVGDKIAVRVTDDLEVQGVAVTIRDTGGEVLEQGAAVFSTTTASWDYTATTALTVGQSVSVEVTATDLPGHTTSKTTAYN